MFGFGVVVAVEQPVDEIGALDCLADGEGQQNAIVHKDFMYLQDDVFLFVSWSFEEDGQERLDDAFLVVFEGVVDEVAVTVAGVVEGAVFPSAVVVEVPVFIFLFGEQFFADFIDG